MCDWRKNISGGRGILGGLHNTDWKKTKITLDMYSAVLYVQFMANRISSAYRLSERTVRWIIALSELLGLSKTGVIERAVLDLAQRNKIKP
jgi:hypothetical protein